MSSYDCPNPATCHYGGRCDYGCQISTAEDCPCPQWCAQAGKCNLAAQRKPEPVSQQPVNSEAWDSWKEALGPDFFSYSEPQASDSASFTVVAKGVRKSQASFTRVGGGVRN